MVDVVCAYSNSENTNNGAPVKTSYATYLNTGCGWVDAGKITEANPLQYCVLPTANAVADPAVGAVLQELGLSH